MCFSGISRISCRMPPLSKESAICKEAELQLNLPDCVADVFASSIWMKIPDCR